MEQATRWTANALAVLEKRYLWKDGEGKVTESPEDLFKRVAGAIAEPEGRNRARWAERFSEMMLSRRFMPNTPTLMNAGKKQGQLSACFVIPVKDSLDGIFGALQHAAKIHQSGGGTGFSFSELRPAGSLVKSTHGVASGPVSFIRIFDVATETIKQGGARRGANMAVLSVDHPDIFEFIDSKRDMRSIINFNISVGATDEFMEAVLAKGRFALRDPKTREEVRSVAAQELFERITQAAWECGDPGLVFLDRVNRFNPTPRVGAMVSTNPCVTGDTRIWVEGEGMVPVRKIVGTTPKVATAQSGVVTFQRTTRVICTGVKPVFRLRTQDGIELRLTGDHLVTTAQGDRPARSLRPGDKIQALVGFGSVPRADCYLATVSALELEGEEEVFDLTEPATGHFYANGILVHNCGEQPLLPYESCNLGSLNLGLYEKDDAFDWELFRRDIHAAVRFLDNVIDVNTYPVKECATITHRNRKIGLGVMGFADLLLELELAYDSDAARALGERIMSFLDREAKNASMELARERGAFKNFKGSLWDRLGYPPLRNATVSTVAPTGTISMIAGCSSGIEPIFAAVFYRNVLSGARLLDVHPAVLRKLNEKGASIEGLTEEKVGELLGKAWSPASRVSTEGHVRMQAEFQRHSDSAVSKTVNLPEAASIAEVSRAYLEAYRNGCKGITIYRDRSRPTQVLDRGTQAAKEAEVQDAAYCPSC